MWFEGVGAPLQHNKLVVVDGATVWTGSANFTERAFASEANNALVIDSEGVARRYTACFDAMVDSGKIDTVAGSGIDTVVDDAVDVEVFCTDRPMAVASSGGSSRIRTMEQAIVDALDGAESSIDVAMNILTLESQLDEALRRASRRGLPVRVLVDDNMYAKHLTSLCGAGVEVYKEQRHGVLHHKYAVIDASGADPLVVTGSANWSESGMDRNFENVVILRSAEVASAYAADWLRMLLWAASPARQLCGYFAAAQDPWPSVIGPLAGPMGAD